MELIYMNWTDVAAYLKEDDRIILPVGSTEQHGPCMVFGTDHCIPSAIARKAAEELRAIAAPPLPFGMSIHHLEFPGSITLKPSTFMIVLRDIIWSLRNNGFRRFQILNGHGGNRASAEAALAEICNEFTDIKVRFTSWWELPEVEKYITENFGEREGHHSTPSESSLMLYLFPFLSINRKIEYRPTVRGSSFVNRFNFKDMYPNGVIGADVNLASKEHGEKLFELAVNDLVTVMKKW